MRRRILQGIIAAVLMTLAVAAGPWGPLGGTARAAGDKEYLPSGTWRGGTPAKPATRKTRRNRRRATWPAWGVTAMRRKWRNGQKTRAPTPMPTRPTWCAPNATTATNDPRRGHAAQTSSPHRPRDSASPTKTRRRYFRMFPMSPERTRLGPTSTMVKKTAITAPTGP